MQVDIDEALRSMLGTSAAADVLIERLASNPQRLLQSESSSAIDEDTIEAALAEIIGGAERGEPVASTQKITSVIVYLLETVEAQREEIASLENQLEQAGPSKESDSEEVSAFKKDFMLSLEGRKIGDLRLFYTSGNLEKLKPNTRKVVADCLIQFSEEKGKKPSGIWEAISTNNGNMP